MLGIFAQIWIWDVLHWTCEWRTDMPLCKIRVIHRLAWTCLSLKIRHPLIRCTIFGHLLIYISVHFSNALCSTGWWITICWPNLLNEGTRRWWPRSHNVPHVGISANSIFCIGFRINIICYALHSSISNK